jgi:hypothetical protein
LATSVPELQFTQRIRRRDYLRFVAARWPREFVAVARRNVLGWLTLPIGVLAFLATLPAVIVKAIRRFPVEQQIRLDDEGVTMRVGERSATRRWDAFDGCRTIAGCRLLVGDAGDVLLLAQRLPAAQRAVLDARLAQVFGERSTAPADSGARAG